MPLTRGKAHADVKQITTIAELRTYTGFTGASCQVLGYYAAGDGGGGPVRIWGTAGGYTDNGGSVIVPTGGDGSGAWIWEHTGVVDVEWFGAGTVDDSDIIESVLSTVGDVRLSKTYIITRQLNITRTSSLNITSVNAKFNLVSTPSIQYFVNIVSGGHDINMRGNLHIECNKKAFTGLRIDNNSDTYGNVHIEDLRVTQPHRASTGFSGGDGIMIQGSFDNVYLLNPHIKNASMASGAGVSGVEGIFGITTKSTTVSRFVKQVVIKGAVIDTVYSEDLDYTFDQDGIRVFPPTENGVDVPHLCHAVIESSTFINCRGRSIKAQTPFTTVSDCLFIRNAGGNYTTGNQEIDFQKGGGDVRNIRCIYTSFAPKAVITFQGSRESTVDERMLGGSANGVKVSLKGAPNIISSVFEVIGREQPRMTVSISDVQLFATGQVDKFLTVSPKGSTYLSFSDMVVGYEGETLRINSHATGGTVFVSFRSSTNYRTGTGSTNGGNGTVSSYISTDSNVVL